VLVDFAGIADIAQFTESQIMTYRAAKIPLTCDEFRVRQWSNYMLGHMEEVLGSLNREGVRHEAWYLCPGQPLCVIGLMDVDDADAAALAMSASILSVDRIHRQFKEHWLRSGITQIQFDPSNNQLDSEYELLFEARTR
jgi:hypothetical protein